MQVPFLMANAGEYEKSMALSWHRSANLRAFILNATCPDPIRFCAEMFEKLTKPQVRNTPPVDSLFPDVDAEDLLLLPDAEDPYADFPGPEKPLPHEIYSPIRRAQPGSALPLKAKSAARIRHQGIPYTSWEVHEGNSGIFVEGNDGFPFWIEQFVRLPDSHDRTGTTWIAVRRHKPANVKENPYVQYPQRLWSVELEPYLEAFLVEKIDAQFAKCAMTWEGIPVTVFVSLDRVSFLEDADFEGADVLSHQLLLV